MFLQAKISADKQVKYAVHVREGRYE